MAVESDLGLGCVQKALKRRGRCFDVRDLRLGPAGLALPGHGLSGPTVTTNEELSIVPNHSAPQSALRIHRKDLAISRLLIFTALTQDQF